MGRSQSIGLGIDVFSRFFRCWFSFAAALVIFGGRSYLLRADPNLTSDGAAYLEEVVAAGYRMKKEEE